MEELGVAAAADEAGIVALSPGAERWPEVLVHGLERALLPPPRHLSVVVDHDWVDAGDRVTELDEAVLVPADADLHEVELAPPQDVERHRAVFGESTAHAWALDVRCQPWQSGQA